MKKLALVICLNSMFFMLAHCQIQTHIAAKQVNSEPWVRFPTSYHENQMIQAAVNPSIHNLNGETVDIYIF
ncbi:MAG: hypothetical protein ACI8XB_003039 [Patiriisocius sp.]|jgi:hypothetical protein